MLFNSVIFGPVQSRRLGVSLGVNLLPRDAKYCNFNCVYCECGWNRQGVLPRFPSLEEFNSALEERLEKMRSQGAHLDVITFAGNGEPTIHPQFPEIVDSTLRLRDKYYPDVAVTVLSNATLLHNPGVFAALQRVDRPVLKLDSAMESTFQLLNQPKGAVHVEGIIEQLQHFGSEFTLQILFTRGLYRGESVDNTTEEEILALLAAIERIRPRRCMVYTIDRETPEPSLERIPVAELEAIAERIRLLDVEVQVNG